MEIVRIVSENRRLVLLPHIVIVCSHKPDTATHRVGRVDTRRNTVLLLLLLVRCAADERRMNEFPWGGTGTCDFFC